MPRSVAIGEIEQQAEALAEETRRGEAVVVTRHGRPAFVLLDIDRYREIQPLLNIPDLVPAEDDPQTVDAVQRGLRDIKAGRTITHAALLARLGLDG